MIILYAEDDIDDFNFFCEIAQSFDPTIKCINTRNGAETIAYLEDMVILPDLIVLDINMPAMDGKSCLREIRKDPRFNSVDIIVYTTTKNSKDKEQCLQLGATEYIEKPNSLSEAQQKLSRFIGRGQQV